MFFSNFHRDSFCCHSEKREAIRKGAASPGEVRMKVGVGLGSLRTSAEEEEEEEEEAADVQQVS